MHRVLPYYTSHFYRSYHRWATILDTFGKLNLDPASPRALESGVDRASLHVEQIMTDPFWDEVLLTPREELPVRLDAYEAEIKAEHGSVPLADTVQYKKFDQLCTDMQRRIDWYRKGLGIWKPRVEVRSQID